MLINEAFKKSQLEFLILLLVLSIPFWLLGAMAEQLSKWLPMNLPASALMIVCPFTAALILVYRQEKTDGIRRLLQSAFDYRGIKQKIWYVPIISLMPLILLLSYWIMRLLRMPLPESQVSFLSILALFVVFFISAVLEEVGWTGYLTPPMLDRWSALKTGIVLGFVWSIWHAIPYIQGRHDLTWIIWQSLFSVAARVLIVWIYNSSGKSVFAAILFHTMINVSDALFPVNGSHYNPAVTGPITIVFAVIVTFLWGSKTLSSYRYTRTQT